ncbi:MAG: Extracellular ligand-binding receptor [uncultured bacterium]|uniref:Extracellular ligand-binding receptor n=1 Tax=Candidatus Wolfebacteria bacterium GW2011_GWC2_39_22 TaxID=1619013 RepID=A0A0G0QPG0_9BACT|nr:MAG: Extracellular ligand-binding receptor [uncultured bacterium]KKR12285.1 MAG: Extracellular ligand-binding receptor [Candidatus Wolfebacteria bacterium GW2011_GWC2_39_22]HBI25916.1 hypothetical protein [Candidatus Wolfebacteria bacterium]
MQKNIKTVIAVVVVLLVGSGIYFATNNNKGGEQQPLTIGYIGPLTGPSAVLGMDAIKAIEIAVAETNEKGGINGQQVRLVAEDDQYLTKNTVSAYSKLVNTDKAKVIMIATYGGVFAVAEQAKKDGVVVIDPLDCNSQVANADKNIFCIATETESIGYSLADYMIENDMKKAGIMYSTKDSFMALVNDAFTKRYTEKGGVVQVESFNYDDTDFRTQLTKLKQGNADGLVLLGHDETGLIMKQARNLGINAKFLATGTITSPPAQQAAEGAAEGTVFAYWEASADNALAKAFEGKFVAVVGRGPILPLTTHPAYDTTKLLLEVVFPNISAKMNVNDIKKELLSVKGYMGTTGEISMDAMGAARIKESVFKLVNGAPVKL